VRVQVSHPYTTTGKIYTSVYPNLYIFGQQTGRQNIPHRMIANKIWFESAQFKVA
jgi:hypothetical protein